MGVRQRELIPDSGRSYFGAEMRRVRTEAELSLTQAAKIVGYSKTHLADVETTRRFPPEDLPARLDAAFDTKGHFTRIYALVTRERHPGKYRRFMELEESAEAAEAYTCHTVYGRVQTPAYAAALFRAGDPMASDEVIRDRVAARMARKNPSGDGAPYTWVILDEAVLRRCIGSPRTMREQLASLVPLCEGPRGGLQILPFAAGAHPLLGGSLTLLTLPDSAGAAYTEGFDAGDCTEDPVDVTRLRRIYDRLRSYALPPAESADLLRKTIEEYT